MTARKFTLILLLWVLMLSGVALWGTFGYCGRLVFPLDDTYIFLQYARTAAAGYPFQYQIGALPSTGASSLPYTIVLTLFAVILPGREALVWACYLLGVVILFGIGWFLWRGMARVVGEARARWMGLAAVSLGPLVWLTLSGMDGGMLALALVLSLLAYAQWMRGSPAWIFWLMLGLASWVRQEGMAAWAVTVFMLIIWQGRFPRRSFHPLIFLAPILYLGQGFLYLSVTGRFFPFGMISKSPWINNLIIGDLLTNSMNFLIFTFKSALLGLSSSEYTLYANSPTVTLVLLPPFALALALWGAVRFGSRADGRFHPALMGIAWLGAMTVATSLFTPNHHHWFRYIIPFLVLLIPGMVLGIECLAKLTTRLMQKRFAMTVWGILFGGLLFAGTITFVFAYGRNSRDIYAQQVQAAEYLSKKQWTVLTHDVGALAYYGTNKLVDVVGLITPGMAELKHLGKGATLEELYRMPPGSRPEVFAGFPTSVNYTDVGFWKQRLWKANLTTHLSITGWDPFEIWTLDWTPWENKERAVSRTLYDLMQKGVMADELDMGYIKSEKAHELQQANHDPELGWVRVAALNFPPDDLVQGGFMDAGRMLLGSTSFEMMTKPGREHVLVLRVNNQFSAKVLVDGKELGAWNALEPMPEKTFRDASLTIPAEMCTGNRIQIELEAADNGVNAPVVFHIFLIAL